MIPIKLRISGFTSYTEDEPAEIDFSGFNVACISGPNGAGKSSLLDAITYALYGKARRSDEAIINSASKKAEVVFDFVYEQQTYRIVRSLQRGKGSQVELFLLNPNAVDQLSKWKVLTEHSLRETNAKIEQILRLDYDTFINASFFLQGKADLFATQKPRDRKRILASIMGLDQWEVYRERARERIRERQQDVSRCEGSLEEIRAELDQEAERKANLALLEVRLSAAKAQVADQQALLEQQKVIRQKVDEQKRVVALLWEQVRKSKAEEAQTIQRLDEKQRQLGALRQELERADDIRADYLAYQDLQKQLTEVDRIAEQFRPINDERQELLSQRKIRRSELMRDLEHLQKEEEQVRLDQQRREELAQLIQERKARLDRHQTRLSRQEKNRAEKAELQQQSAQLQKENGELGARGKELNERMDKLDLVTGGVCPLCGQPLSGHDRERLKAELEEERERLRLQYKANREGIQEIELSRQRLEKEEAELKAVEQEAQSIRQDLARLTQQQEQLEAKSAQWQGGKAEQLVAIQLELEQDSFLPEIRQKIVGIEAKLSGLGYDAQAHAALRQKEQSSRFAVDAFHHLEIARNSVKQSEEAVRDLEVELAGRQKNTEEVSAQHTEAASRLAADEAQLPDARVTERTLVQLQEETAVLQRQVGAAGQLVDVLSTRREQQQRAQKELEETNQEIGRLKVLEKAFSKDGVPAMLIEQVLPELENYTNDILRQLSDFKMSVSFSSQRAYRDARREDSKETLDILISDGSSPRDYETYSGGEAFKVNFAIRLALSQMLSRRANARLRTIIIDEGFGNQDAQGRQRLIEAINRVTQEFDKILIITHIEELKDAFPNRIEVEKTETGSRVKVIME